MALLELLVVKEVDGELPVPAARKCVEERRRTLLHQGVQRLVAEESDVFDVATADASGLGATAELALVRSIGLAHPSEVEQLHAAVDARLGPERIIICLRLLSR
eukprot:scaffold125122_cov63-Phaeocystis_antarctica.AAC.3